MFNLTLDEITKAVNGKLILKGNKLDYSNVSTDTRKLKDGSVFIALKGERFNANDFIVEASKKGAHLCIVSESKFDEKDIRPETSIILVDNTHKALLSLAKYYRNKLDIKVVGITGSTGKTSTKDLVAAALSYKYKVFKTKGNFNNEIGLPLMILEMDNSFDIAVLEMGMSNFGEIHRLVDVARPDVALITNIGISHIENLKTQENILKSKMEITDYFSSENTLIVNNDDKFLSNISTDKFKTNTIGIESISDYCAESIIVTHKDITFNINDKKQNKIEKFNINVLGKHNVLNSLMAIACARIFGLNYDEIKKGLNNIETTSMRLDIIKGEKFTIVNDCYNASPDSVKAAIDVVISLKGTRKIAVLGSMGELGHKAYEAHVSVAEYAKKKGIDYLCTLGEFNEAFKEGFGEKNYKGFKDKEKLIVYLKEFSKKDDIILVKASRYMKFENITEKLQTIN